MIISIKFQKRFVQTHWAVGHCEKCGCSEAIRVGEIVGTTSLYGAIPLLKEYESMSALCDFCGQFAVPFRDSELLDVRDWTYGEGLRSLFERCAPERSTAPPRFRTDAEIRRMLQAIARATRFSKVDLSDGLPPLLGAAVGSVTCLLTGAVLDEIDDGASVGLALLIGVIGGGFLGIVLGGLRACRRESRKLIATNHLKYAIDGDVLTRLAEEFPARIREAVRLAVGQSDRPDKLTP